MIRNRAFNFSRLLSPLICLGLLGYVAAGQRNDPRERDFVAFHAAVKDAVNEIPTAVGAWVGENREVPASAVALLRPNAIRNIEFRNIDPTQALTWPNNVYLTIVQCQRTQDMLGHYPPRCYPSYGDTFISQKARDWKIEDSTIRGMEYVFERNVKGTIFRRTVYNFMIVPDQGIVRDMNELVLATEDDRQRYYGAAQIQVVFVSQVGQEPSESDRDEVFDTFVRAAWPAIQRIELGRENFTSENLSASNEIGSN